MMPPGKTSTLTLHRFALAVVSFAGTVTAILGPISTDKPVPAGGDVATTDAPNSFFQGFSPPFPTNQWWAGYGAGSGDAICAGPFPYETSLISSGIQFGISTSRQFDGTSIKQPTQTDWTAGFSEHSGNANDHKTTGWDMQSVTVQYFTGSSSLTSYMVPGSPYLTFNYVDATPVFTSGQGLITAFNGTTVSDGSSTNATGTKFIVDTANDGSYLIYSLSGPLTLTAQSSNGGGTLTGSKAFTGVLRMVKLNDTSHEALLDQYAANYPTGVTTDYSFSNNDTGILNFTWTVVGDADNLLMLTWPHHRIKMQSLTSFPSTSSLNYLTTKGYMYPVLGNTWIMQYDLPTIDWFAARFPDNSCLWPIIEGLQYEISLLNASTPSVPGDFYSWGVSINAQARLALIAEHIGRSDLIPQVTEYLAASYEYWFTPGSAVLPAHETGWGGIVDSTGYNNVNVDYGNGYYNDHHFHYGYFLAGSAVIARYNSTWLNEHETTINYFIRDIANPSPDDPYFPVTRCRDWFAGHSWASGIANGAGSRDQESTGEAVNAYYGAMLWADVTGNTDLKNYARLLLATEQHGAQVYWHLYPEADSSDPNQPYPEQDVRELVTIGNVEDWQSGAWLFWGAEKVEIAAIQMLPVTPVNELLYDTAWVQNVWSYAADELNNATYDDSWRCVILCAYSNFDPVTAMEWSTRLTDWGSGNTYTNQVYFVSTRPNPTGQPLCNSSGEANPAGSYTFQSADTGNFVVASSSTTNLAATGTSSDATLFNLSFVPNAGTILDISTSQYVTADISGQFALAAARTVASTWESFVIRPKVGAASNVYSIQAVSNKLYVVIASDGTLINNGSTEADSSGFMLNSV